MKFVFLINKTSAKNVNDCNCISDNVALYVISYKLCGKCPYLEFFWSVFSCIRTEYGDIRSESRYSVRMQGNTVQENTEYGHFSHSDKYWKFRFLDKNHCTIS